MGEDPSGHTCNVNFLSYGYFKHNYIKYYWDLVMIIDKVFGFQITLDPSL